MTGNTCMSAFIGYSTRCLNFFLAKTFNLEQCLVNVVQSYKNRKISSWTSAYFVFWEREFEGEVFVIASALKSFILKLDIAVSTFPDTVQD